MKFRQVKLKDTQLLSGGAGVLVEMSDYVTRLPPAHLCDHVGLSCLRLQVSTVEEDAFTSLESVRTSGIGRVQNARAH